MKSSQINLYITLEDTLEIEKYLVQQSIFCIPQPILSPVSFLEKPIIEIQSKAYRPDIILLKKDYLSLLKFHFIDSEKHYLINISESPVIEFWFPLIQKQDEKLLCSRFYYTKDILDIANKTEIPKPTDFLQIAEDLFHWLKKTFKNAKLPGYEGYLVSQRAAAWVKEAGGTLVKW